MAGVRILVADDDAQLVSLVRDYLQNEGFSVLTAADGPGALQAWREQDPALLVLDWMMPGLSGLDVCRRVRAAGRTPVIMLTARGEEPDRLLGLELGADDYIVKPFSLRELAARIRAVLRRAQPDGAADTVAFGDVVIDFAGHAVQLGDRDAGLTPTEFKLLIVLARSPGRVFSRMQLAESALGEYFEGYDRTIDSHISHLRRKLGEGAGHRLIQTVQGVGYKLVPAGK